MPHEKTNVSFDVREDGSAHIKLYSSFPAKPTRRLDISFSMDVDKVAKINVDGSAKWKPPGGLQHLYTYYLMTEKDFRLIIRVKGPQVAKLVSKMGKPNLELNAVQKNGDISISLGIDVVEDFIPPEALIELRMISTEYLESVINRELSKAAARQDLYFPTIEIENFDVTPMNGKIAIGATVILRDWRSAYIQNVMAVRGKMKEQEPRLWNLYSLIWPEEEMQKAVEEWDLGEITLNVSTKADTLAAELSGEDFVQLEMENFYRIHVLDFEATWADSMLTVLGYGEIENLWSFTGACAKTLGAPAWRVENVSGHLVKREGEDKGRFVLEMDIPNYTEFTETGQRLTLPPRPMENVEIAISLPEMENAWKGSSVTASGAQMVLFEDLRAGQEHPFEFTAPDQPVTMVKIVPRKNIASTNVIAEVIDKPPKAPKSEGKIYKYIHIETNLPSKNLEEGKIEFKVPREWIEGENASKEDVLMLRFQEGSWKSLPTEITEEKATYIRYSAQTSELSDFAIVTMPKKPMPKKLPWPWIGIGVAIVIALIVALLASRRARAASRL